MALLRFFLAFCGIFSASLLFAQTATSNKMLKGRVLYQSSGSKPATGVRVAEPDANPAYSVDNGDYLLTFQTKRNGASLDLEVGKDNSKGQKLELVNEKEIKAAKLPAGAEELLDIIVCPAGQRDIAAQKYYRILRTTADRELERKKKEVEDLVAQKEKDYQKISDLYAQLDKMQAALDSAKIRGQAFNIASINLDRASQMVQDAVRKIDEENDVEGALKILNAEALDTAYEHASALKRKAETAIRQVVEGYEFKISLLEPQFKYGEVAECYSKIIEIYEKEGYDSTHLAQILLSAADNWLAHGDYQKSLEFSLRAVLIREKIFPAGHPNLAAAYHNLAKAYGNLGDYQKELEFHQKAFSIFEKSLPVDHPDLALSYSGLAATYGNLGEYQKQLEFHSKALAIYEKVLPADHPKLATSYNNMAFAYGDLANYQKQLEFNLKDLSICEKNLPADHPDLARSYHILGWTYRNLGEHKKGLEFNLKAMTIREKVLPGNHPELARSYNNLAVIYGLLGNRQKQLEFHLKAFTIWEKVLPADHPDLAKSYHNLAVTYGNLGAYEKALEFHLKALAIFEKALPADHPELANSYSNIGRAYRDISDYAKGIEYGQKAIHIGEASSPKHPRLSRFYAFLGITYVKSRQYTEAKAALEKSERLKAEVWTYQGWAMYFGLQNDKVKAMENLQKAVDLGYNDLNWITTDESLDGIRDWAAYKVIVEQLQGPNPVVENAGSASPQPPAPLTRENLEAYRIALDSNLANLAVREKNLPVGHPDLARLYNNIGYNYAKLRQFPEAKVYFEKFQAVSPSGRVFRNWAMYYALQNNAPRALENLQKAVDLGYKDLKWIETDDSLQGIRGEQGYKNLVERMKRQ